MNIEKNYPLADETTFKIGGPAEFFLAIDNREQFEEAVKEAVKLDLKVSILGGGSNTLVSSEGVEGLVLKLRSGEIEFLDKDLLRVDAGTSLPRLSMFALEHSLKGLEWAGGVPGTLGGAVYGNAGAFGQMTADLIEEVEVLEKGKKLVLRREDLDFSYRGSIFKEKDLIVISASLRFKKGEKDKIKEKTKKFLERRKNKHPIACPSAGSVFKNPVVSERDSLWEDSRLKKFKEKGYIPSGYLIEEVGLKGKIEGGAKISEKHANFIINENNATSEDVKKIIKEIQEKVLSVFGISLEREIKFLPREK